MCINVFICYTGVHIFVRDLSHVVLPDRRGGGGSVLSSVWAGARVAGGQRILCSLEP